MEDTRPDWPYKVPIKVAKWLSSNRVTEIIQVSKHDGYGIKSDYWLTLRSTRGKREELKKVSERYFDGEELALQPQGQNMGLVGIKREILDRVDEIEVWDKKNKRERVEYERLKKKFEGVVA